MNRTYLSQTLQLFHINQQEYPVFWKTVFTLMNLVTSNQKYKNYEKVTSLYIIVDHVKTG